jgi:hypothetical protein
MLPWVSSLPGYAADNLARTFARTPLSRFGYPPIARRTPRRPRVSIGCQLTSSTWCAETHSPDDTTLVGFLHQTIPGIWAGILPGYGFTSHRAVHCCRPVDVIRKNAATLPELPGPAEVPSIQACCALRSIRYSCSILGVSTSNRPLRIGYSFRVPHSPVYRPYGLSDPTLPLAVSSTLWFSNRRTSLVTFQRPDRALSSSFASIKSVTQLHLANRSQPIGSSHGLFVPTALTGSEIRFTRACRPATFRLQGLATLLAASTL